MKNKKDSYMGDVGIIKKIDDVPELKEELILAFDEKSSSHIDISKYGLRLAQHILDITQIQSDEAILECFEINLKWQVKEVRFQAARDVAFKLNRLAKDEKDPIKIKVYRIMGQVAAIPHVKRHALIASDYAITLINLMYPHNLDEVRKERSIQIDLMRTI
jgi:hypothetical protein